GARRRRERLGVVRPRPPRVESRTRARGRQRASAGRRGLLMLELLDLRERGGRLEPSKLEIDPATTRAVREILQRVFVEGDDVLVELSKQFDGADLARSEILVTEREFARAERETPAELRTAIDALIDRL